jgi:hypothetical protein
MMIMTQAGCKLQGRGSLQPDSSLLLQAESRIAMQYHVLPACEPDLLLHTPVGLLGTCQVLLAVQLSYVLKPYRSHWQQW